MAESPEHCRLVGCIVDWVRTRHVNNAGLCMLADSAGANAGRNPWRVGGFIPDVMVRTVPESFVLIGEAKCVGDLDTRHSRRQLAAFLEFLMWQERPQLVLATPLVVGATARSIVRKLQRELMATKVDVFFLHA